MGSEMCIRDRDGPRPQITSMFKRTGRTLKSHQVPSKRASPSRRTNFQQSGPRPQSRLGSSDRAVPASHTNRHQSDHDPKEPYYRLTGPHPQVTPNSLKMGLTLNSHHFRQEGPRLPVPTMFNRAGPALLSRPGSSDRAVPTSHTNRRQSDYNLKEPQISSD